MTGRTDWKHIVAIFVAALAVRMLAVGWFEMRKPEPLPDEEEYVYIAEGVALGEEPVYESLPWERLMEKARAEMKKQRKLIRMGDQEMLVVRLPGVQRRMQKAPMYPLLVSAVMRMSPHGDEEWTVRGVRVVQAVMGSITAVLVFVLASRFFEGRGRLWAGWIAALYPPWVYATGLLLTETMFIMLLMVCWWLATRIAEKPTASDVLMCGLVGAGAVLTKGSALGLFVVLAPVLVVVSRWKWRAVAAGVCLLLVIAIGISPWVARNYRVTKNQNEMVGRAEGGDVVVTTCSVGRSLYEAVGPEATGGPGMERIDVPLKLAGMTEHEVDQYYWEAAKEEMKAHPWRVAKLAVVKLARTWNVVPNYEGYRKPLYMVAAALSVGPIVILAVWGWWRERRRWREWVLLLLPVGYFTAVHMVFVGSVRYREPVMGMMMILAGAGLAGLLLGRKAEEQESSGAEAEAKREA